MKNLCNLVIAMLIMGNSLTVSAQQPEQSTNDTLLGLGLLTTTTGLIALAGVGSYKISSNNNNAAQQQAYLKANQLDVMEGLATGNGKFIDDLSVALNVPEKTVAAFTGRLTARYEELASLADATTLTPERAERFFQAVIEIRASI